jgi:endo-1,4-beta-mannosidase
VPDEFILGVNYWPRKKAMYWWKDFDRAEVEAEFAEIAALGLRVVRIFLLWEDFQPAADQVSERALADLGTTLDVAAGLGLQVMPTFFTGHMSGINWWPEWALADAEDSTGIPRIAGGAYTPRRGRDPYADPFMLAAERRLVAAVCGRYGAHPAVYSWNLSNEPDLFYMPQNYAAGASWNALLAEEVRRHSALPVSAGMHLPSLTSYNGFRTDMLAPHDDFLSMHAYSIYYLPAAAEEPLNSDVVPVACLACEALGGKPVLLEEFGYASSPIGEASEWRVVRQGSREKRQYLADDASGGRYYAEVLEKLARCGARGAFAWMFSDYDPALWGRPPFDSLVHERWFGLTRADGTVKPSGEAMRAYAQRVAAGALPARTAGPLALDAEAWYADPGGNFERLWREWKARL